jgi:hypothetical protein
MLALSLIKEKKMQSAPIFDPVNCLKQSGATADYFTIIFYYKILYTSDQSQMPVS